MTLARHHGFSLIELMITVAIIGIAAATAFPSAQALLANQKMKTAAFDVVTTVLQARSEAMKWGSPGGASISIKASSSAGGLSDGWCIVFTKDSTCDVLSDTNPGPDVMQANKATAGMTYVSSAADPIEFSYTGRLVTGARAYILVTDDGGYGSARCVVVDSNGNPMTYLQADAGPKFRFGGASSTLRNCAP